MDDEINNVSELPGTNDTVVRNSIELVDINKTRGKLLDDLRIVVKDISGSLAPTPYYTAGVQHRRRVSIVEMVSCCCCAAEDDTHEESELERQINELKMTAGVAVDFADVQHAQLLSILYTGLSGKQLSSNTGPHWEEVGFLGADPTLEFRGMGVYGAAQLAHTSLAYPFVVKEMLDCQLNYPVAIALLHVARLSLELTTTGVVWKLCVSLNSTYKAINVLHAALSLEFHNQWRARKRSENVFHSFFENEFTPLCKRKWSTYVNRFRIKEQQQQQQQQQQQTPPNSTPLLLIPSAAD